MLKSNASHTVLVLLVAIAALELGITGKFTQVWQLAFTGKVTPPTGGAGGGA